MANAQFNKDTAPSRTCITLLCHSNALADSASAWYGFFLSLTWIVNPDCACHATDGTRDVVTLALKHSRVVDRHVGDEQSRAAPTTHRTSSTTLSLRTNHRHHNHDPHHQR